MGGLGLMQEQISQQNHDDLGCDGWEISAHAASAPDHEPIQGKQYDDKTYTALNNSLLRRIGTLNCGHSAFPIIMGVNSPQYTDKELEAMRQDNEAGVTVDGRHYTMYEATQRQRKFERSIRNQKRKILVDKTLEDADKLQTDQIRLVRLRQEYARFSKEAGLPMQHARAEAAGFTWKDAKAAERAARGLSTNSRVASPKKSGGVATGGSLSVASESNWDDSIGPQRWNEEKRKAMYNYEYSTVDKKHEIARIYDSDGVCYFEKKGDSRAVVFSEAEIKQMHGSVLTHNHPNNSCFSPEDINMLRRGKLIEIRAVTAQGVYRLQKPVKWHKSLSSIEKITKVYYDIDKQVSSPIYAKAFQGEITFAQAEALSEKEVIREFGKKYGLGFKFDTWDDIRRSVE